MRKFKISGMGKYILAIGMIIAPAASWAQRMIKVSGTVMNVADKSIRFRLPTSSCISTVARRWLKRKT